MKYREIAPCPALRPFVNCYWHYEGAPGATVTDCSFPDGSIEIIFNIATSVRRSLDGQPFTSNPSSELLGQMTKPYQVKFSGLNRFLGIRFFPHTFSCFARDQLSKLNDITIDPRDVLGPDFEHLARVVHGEEDINRTIQEVEAFLLRKLSAVRADPRHPVLGAVVKAVFQGTIKSITTMQEHTGWNERYLQRLFSEKIGISPKFLLKLVRFQQSFRHLSQRPASITEVAYECGYFDQAHFNRDFRLFTGTTPTRYLKQDYPINRFFLSPETGSYMYGIEPAGRQVAWSNRANTAQVR